MTAEKQQQAMEAQAADAEEYDEEEYEEYAGGGNRFLLFMAMPAWAVSMVVHAIVLLVLGILTFGPDVERIKNIITAAPVTDDMEEFQKARLAEEPK